MCVREASIPTVGAVARPPGEIEGLVAELAGCRAQGWGDHPWGRLSWAPSYPRGARLSEGQFAFLCSFIPPPPPPIPILSFLVASLNCAI